MRVKGVDAGYDLGCYHVPHGAGYCQGECGRDATVAQLFLVPPYGGLQTQFLILWLCRVCAALARKALKT